MSGEVRELVRLCADAISEKDVIELELKTEGEDVDGLGVGDLVAFHGPGSPVGKVTKVEGGKPVVAFVPMEIIGWLVATKQAVVIDRGAAGFEVAVPRCNGDCETCESKMGEDPPLYTVN